MAADLAISQDCDLEHEVYLSQSRIQIEKTGRNVSCPQDILQQLQNKWK